MKQMITPHTVQFLLLGSCLLDPLPRRKHGCVGSDPLFRLLLGPNLIFPLVRADKSGKITRSELRFFPLHLHVAEVALAPSLSLTFRSSFSSNRAQQRLSPDSSLLTVKMSRNIGKKQWAIHRARGTQ